MSRNGTAIGEAFERTGFEVATIRSVSLPVRNITVSEMPVPPGEPGGRFRHHPIPRPFIGRIVQTALLDVSKLR